MEFGEIPLGMSADYRPLSDVCRFIYLKVYRQTRIVFRFFVGDLRIYVHMCVSPKKDSLFESLQPIVLTKTPVLRPQKASLVAKKHGF